MCRETTRVERDRIPPARTYLRSYPFLPPYLAYKRREARKDAGWTQNQA
jgi:hypothetical protein